MKSKLLRLFLYSLPFLLVSSSQMQQQQHEEEDKHRLIRGKRKTNFNTSNASLTLGAFYYPWYGGDFHGHQYLREKLQPQQFPSLGEYDDRLPSIISQHLKWSRQANVHLWVTSWWGKDTREDNTTRLTILAHRELKNHQIALHYETTGRIKKGEGYSLHRVAPDMNYICKTYLSHPNYYTIDGKPVIFVYITRVLTRLGILEQVVQIMRSVALQKCGLQLYIAGDQVFGKVNPESMPFELLDAIFGYDVYGSIRGTGGTLSEIQVQAFFLKQQQEWKRNSSKYNCSFVPTISPGFNDLGVRPEAKHPPLNRKLTNGKQLLAASLKYAKTLVDSNAENLLLVNSWNEFHEDSQIEPVVGESTSEPYNLTHGLEYHGYEDLYLEILRQGTTVRTGSRERQKLKPKVKW